MPMDIIPKAAFPLVPNLPGVPALVRSAVQIADAATLGVFGLTGQFDELVGNTPQWGVFDAAGKAVAAYDSFVGMDFRNTSRISDFPQEQGAFASYNKVNDPFESRIALSCGGSVIRRAAFLDAMEAAAQSLDLFTIVTPERIYLNANIQSVDYRRQVREGAGNILIELQIREIRQTASIAYSAPKSVSAAPPQSQGQVQPIATEESPMPGVHVITVQSDGLFK